MKKLLFIALAIAYCGTVAAQDTFEVKILDSKKDKPVRGVWLSLTSEKKLYSTDKNGICLFKNVKEEDTLILNLGKLGMRFLPIGPMDSAIVLKLNKNQVSQNRSIGRAESNIDVQKLVDNGANSIGDIIRMAGIAGVQFVQGPYGGMVPIVRGIGTTYANNEPMVLLNGVSMDYYQAESAVVIREIETIKVLKDGSIYGPRGVNGVIVITTKSR